MKQETLNRLRNLRQPIIFGEQFVFLFLFILLLGLHLHWVIYCMIVISVGFAIGGIVTLVRQEKMIKRTKGQRREFTGVFTNHDLRENLILLALTLLNILVIVLLIL